MSQNIFSKILILILNFSFSLSLIPPISTIEHKIYTINLNSSSKYIIYSYQSKYDISTKYDIVFHFSKVPKYSTKFFVYYSKEDVSKNIDNLISYDPKTGEFYNFIYSTSLDNLDKMNYEVVLNSDYCDVKYLLQGYFYAVISIVSDKPESEYTSEFFLFGTASLQIINILNNYEYYKIGGPYKDVVNFYIPILSRDIILDLNFKCTSYSQKRITIYKYKTEAEVYNTKTFYGYSYNSYYKLVNGYGYFVLIQNSYKDFFTYEVLFQFPPNELMKLEEGMPITTSTLIDYDYYFYYDCSQMKKGDELFIQIPNKSSSSYLYYSKLDSIVRHIYFGE